MSANRSMTEHTVRPISHAKIPKLVYVAAFILCSAIAYWWGGNGNPSIGPRPESTSTAVLHIQSAKPAGSGPTATSTPNEPTTLLTNLTSAEVRQQILTHENIVRVAQPGRTSLEWIVRLQQKLGVDVATDATPGGTRISIVYADEDPHAAALLVNGLADAYAEELRQQWRSQAEKTCSDAHAAMTREAEALRQATARGSNRNSNKPRKRLRSHRNQPLPRKTPQRVPR